MQERNGDEDVENGLVGTVEDGESGMNGESIISVSTLSYEKWIATEKLPYYTQPSLVLCYDPEGWKVQVGGEMCAVVADLHCCMAEADAIL